MHAGRQESLPADLDPFRIGAGAIRDLQGIAAAVVEECEASAVGRPGGRSRAGGEKRARGATSQRHRDFAPTSITGRTEPDLGSITGEAEATEDSAGRPQ